MCPRQRSSPSVAACSPLCIPGNDPQQGQEFSNLSKYMSRQNAYPDLRPPFAPGKDPRAGHHRYRPHRCHSPLPPRCMDANRKTRDRPSRPESGRLPATWVPREPFAARNYRLRPRDSGRQRSMEARRSNAARRRDLRLDLPRTHVHGRRTSGIHVSTAAYPREDHPCRVRLLPCHSRFRGSHVVARHV